MRVAKPTVAKIQMIFLSFLVSYVSLTTVQNPQALGDVVDTNHTSCLSCHRMPESDISATNIFPSGMDPSSVCLDCHHYSNNHHPVNFIPGASYNNPVFPLFDGEIRCLTCHSVHGEEGHAGIQKLLRGGPYKYRTEICFGCHDKDLNTRVNPHRMIDDQGAIRKVNGAPVCLMCHATLPDETTDPLQVTFKADVAFLCWRCHPPMANDEFFKGHFLAKPKKRTLDYMRRWQEENMVSLPLFNRDRITCSTCHNPHQKGVISYGPAQAGADAPARLRVTNGTLCSGCHDI